MKLVLASLLLAMAPAASFAVSADFGGGFTTPGYELEYTYTSWCDGSNILAQDSKGELVQVEDCKARGSICRMKEAYRGRKVMVSAYCSIQ